MRNFVFILVFFSFSSVQAIDINVFCVKDDARSCETSLENILSKLQCDLSAPSYYVECPSVSYQSGAEVFICTAGFVEGCEPAVINRFSEASCTRGTGPIYLTYGDEDLVAMWNPNKPVSICRF